MRSETSPEADRKAAASSAREVIELLEVLWSTGRDMASPAPVSSSQLRVLYTLDRDQPINLRTLGAVLGSAPSSVSRMCDRLEALGFVERCPSSSSRREVELRLSPRGERYLKELRGRRETALLDVISTMPADDRAALATGLRSFRMAVDGGTSPSARTTAESA
ncbi:MarR family transcriptional regulator [Streptomyces sp. DH12]|uniref:MarR family winged helix-turn-helix transcriptional regulator n=1 Tax=Streptomyces sp. DH12 TaxID=2857010 RepID=UPI001E4C4BCE|nr:MarR family transcriptional regulator [Streptomyces sp. DH12]